jgi:clan AA aspartic protease (TIGR02281 family)
MRRLAALLGVALCAGVGSAAHADSVALPAVMAVTLQKHDAGTFYVHGAIEGFGELELLVDTGASYLVINEKILATLKAAGAAEYSRELRGTMADGSARQIPVYRISALRLGTQCWIPNVEAAVFPGAARPILGMNVLTRLAPFTFSAEPPQLGLAQCQPEVASANDAAAETAAVEQKASARK